MQDGSDKQHKKVRVLDLVTCLGFILSALPHLGLTQLQAAGHLSLYHGLTLNSFKFYCANFIKKIHSTFT